MDENYMIISAAVDEYLQVSEVRDWSDKERIAARAAVRGVMVRLNYYSRFCDQLEERLALQKARQ